MKKRNKKNLIYIDMPEALINDKVVKELEMLFEISPPFTLKKSVTTIFFEYLSNTDVEFYESNLKEIASDFYFLIKFLEKAEKENSRKSTRLHRKDENF
jgi:hypothetical protein